MKQPTLKIDSRSVDRFAAGGLMIAHVGEEGSAFIDQDGHTFKGVTLDSNLRLGNATIVSTFPREGFPSPDESGAWERFLNDLRKEGLIPAETDPDEAQALDELALSIIKEFNETGRGLYRIEYQAQWDPEKDFQQKLEKFFDDSLLVPPDDLPKEAAPPVADLPDFRLGGTLFAGNAKYQIFDVQPNLVQAEAIYSGVKPHVVSLLPSDVMGYEPPAPGTEDLEAVSFIAPEGMKESDLRKKYDLSLQLIKSLKRDKQSLNTKLGAVADPARSVLVDLAPGLLVIEQTHNPSQNRDVDRLKAHYAATMQLLLSRIPGAPANRWNAIDHMAQEHTAEDGDALKLVLSIQVEAEFSDIDSALINKGKLTAVMTSQDGTKISWSEPISSGSKTPSEPELFSEGDFRPITDVPMPKDPPESAPADEIILDEHGVRVTSKQLYTLSESKRKSVDSWRAIMAGREGTRKFPACLIPWITFDRQNPESDAELAYKDGKTSHARTHDLTIGSAQHYFWMNAFRAAKAAKK